ncbi:uncharacterized protein LOC34619929 [Cyclospora cayetanensis]|uniref:Uncharacterized protein LOC34619929 n=1 Tax=Cyclospora cayetanensis TaxID=88456 RepID=A0A6P6RR95_9EIME|nr:uncharacterized protein LOC34619929 [Cyclospora cayetanensis]
MPEGSPESSRDSQSLRSKGRAAAHPVAAAAARSLYAVRVTSRRPPALADLVAVSLGSQREKLAERAKTALGAAAFTRSVSIGMQDQRRTAEDDAQASSHEGAAFMPVEEQVQGPAPVFASGNADLERRLLQTFSALSLPSFAPSTTGPPAAAPTVAARASEAPTSVAEGREELPQARQERAGEPAAACSSPTRQHVEDEGTHGERAQPSPGAWSEATDSTGCTDTPDLVRPPAFGSWVHYSLTDVPEEAMTARGMQRACNLLLLQRRHAPEAAPSRSSVGNNSSAASNTGSAAGPPCVSTSFTPGESEEADDPRVCVGPRRRG